MHSTLSKDVKGFIDEVVRVDDTRSKAKGWAFYAKNMEVLPLRLAVDDGQFFDVETKERGDVGQFYKNSDVHECGWEFTFFHTKKNVLQMNIYNQWENVFGITLNEEKKSESTPYGVAQPSVEGGVPNSAPPDFLPKMTRKIPTFLVIDNFYDNPDEVRDFALKCNFKAHPQNHKGMRTDECYRFPGLKERFEDAIGAKISSWDKYGTNACFQVCLAGDQIVYHHDAQEYAGVLFLSKDAPPQSGTSFYRSIHNKKMRVTNMEDHAVIFKGGFYDPTQFDLVDKVGNVYNRVVLFDARLIHAANDYFGTTKENGRLFQLFFFDLEK